MQAFRRRCVWRTSSERFSSRKRLVRATAIVLVAVEFWKGGVGNSITARHVPEAETLRVHTMQAASYATDWSESRSRGIRTRPDIKIGSVRQRGGILLVRGRVESGGNRRVRKQTRDLGRLSSRGAPYCALLLRENGSRGMRGRDKRNPTTFLSHETSRPGAIVAKNPAKSPVCRENRSKPQ